MPIFVLRRAIYWTSLAPFAAAPLALLCLFSFVLDTAGQTSPSEKQAPAATLHERRIADLARRIASADTEQEADALLESESELIRAELGDAILSETLRMRNLPVPREKILKAGLRLLRYTERTDMAAARGAAERAVGVAYSNLENWEKSEKHLLTAISVFSRLGPRGRHGVMSAFRDLAFVYQRKGDIRRAAEQYQKLVGLARQHNDPESVIQANNSLSAVYLKTGDFANSYIYLEQSLRIAETLPDKGAKLASLVQLAATYLSQGRIGKAVEAQENAYRTAVEAGSPLQLNYLFQTAALYVKLGDLPSAYTRFRRVIAGSEKNNDRSLYFHSLLNIAQIHERYGREKRAAELYQRVIEFSDDAVKERSSSAGRSYVTGKVEAIARLAEIKVAREDIRSAINMYSQNLKTLRSAQAEPESDPGMRSKETYEALEVSTLIRLGELYSSLGDRSEATSHFASALAISEKNRYESGSIDALLTMAVHAARNGEHGTAGSHLYRAEVLVRRSGRIDQLVRLNTTNAEVHVKFGRLAAADLKFQEALRISESLRSDVTMPDQRASYFAGLFRPFDQYIDFLMERHAKEPDAGFDRRAFDVSERRRARALLDSLRVARADIRQGVDPALLEEEHRIRSQLNSAARENFGTIDPLALHALVDDDDLKKLPTGQPKADIAFLAAELARVETAIRKQSPRYAELMQPRPLRSNAVQTLLDDDTVLLNFTLGEKQSYLWAVTKRSVSSFVLPPREKIEDMVRTAYVGLSDRSFAEERKREVISGAETLARVLLGPASDLIGDRRIVVVADGALQYLPFSSLPDPRLTVAANGSMLLSNEIQFAPSASVVSVLRQDASDRVKTLRSVAVFADPVFSADDERLDGRKDVRPAGTRSEEESVTRDLFLPETDDDDRDSNATPGIARLPFSRREADAIFESAPVESSLKAVDFQASRENLATVDLPRYRIVHFATHGILNSEQPELSGIVLSLVNEKGEPVNGFLRLNEIYNMKLNADLVVLSACQTALGKEVRGEGLIGLTRGFMYAGTPRVIASLWKVDDVATAELMKIFYRKMLKENKRPAAALREAKVEMMKQKRWNSPYYWAAFELQGDWR